MPLPRFPDTSSTSFLRSPQALLILLSFAMALSFSSWQTLLNNFVIERASFGGAEIGLLQSLREVPGFLAFTAVFLLWFLREQTLLLLALAVMGIGVAVTGYFPSALGLYCTTVLMSIGFHYFETVQQSLALQWLPKNSAAHGFGRLLSAKSAAALLAYGGVWLATVWLALDYQWIYLSAGLLTVLLVLLAAVWFPQFPPVAVQHKKLVLRKRYWLYYALTFMSGARRQIFVVFAGFLMVEKFSYSVSQVAVLYLINHAISLYAAPRIGSWIGKVGERHALMFEYCGLILIFVSYAFVEQAELAAGLYVLDHIFFAMAIAIKTYFQKIVAAEDIAASAAVSFSINHIAAVFIPVLFGLLWLQSPALVFLFGALMALISLLLALNVPRQPGPDNVAVWGNLSVAPAAAD